MKIRVKLFGGLQKYYAGDLTHPDGMEIEIPEGANAGALLRYLKLPEDMDCVVITQGKVLKGSDNLQDRWEVMIMVPMSGG